MLKKKLKKFKREHFDVARLDDSIRLALDNEDAVVKVLNPELEAGERLEQGDLLSVDEILALALPR